MVPSESEKDVVAGRPSLLGLRGFPLATESVCPFPAVPIADTRARIPKLSSPTWASDTPENFWASGGRLELLDYSDC